jgi:LacI family transcriptional regulator
VVAVSIENLAAKGVRTFALLSELNAKCNVGYIGMDNWKVGRTAGWALANICKSGGKVGTLVGNHRYRCQETSDSGFRSYFREHPCELDVLEARSTFETSSIAQEQVEQMLEQHADLVGIYVAGGGISGACAALRTSGKAKSVALVGHELTETTRAALLDGTINLLLSHPMQFLAQQTIAAMIRCHDAGPDYPPESISLPFEVITPENL